MHAVLFSRFNRRACHCNRPYRLVAKSPSGGETPSNRPGQESAGRK